MVTSDIQHKRAVLLSARMRFSPETQPIRETAIDKIVEQNLLLSGSEDGLTLREIQRQGLLNFSSSVPVVGQRDLQAALDRLVQSRRVLVLLEDELYYRLSPETQDELWALQRESERRVSSVVMRLFKNSTDNCRAYEAPFLECLSVIFAQLGEAYVRLLKGDIGHQDVLSLPPVLNALRLTKEKYPEIEPEVFESGVITFFRESHPDYDAIKWNMGQNYYVAKALGIDPTGHLLSVEVFGSASFYLDTNVIISALEPMARHHSSFQAFSKACGKLGIRLFFCQISLDELNSVLEYNRELIEKVVDQIPEATAPKVNGVFFQVFREYKKSSDEFDFNAAFSNFLNPMDCLIQVHKAELVDDVWFERASEEKATQVLAVQLRQATESRRGWPKTQKPALHDALVLRWIEAERAKGQKNVWLLTLDNSLPGIIPESGGTSVSIALDALLQWISPIAFPSAQENGVAAAYSEAIKYQLLPQESFFSLQDFLVFAEMEWKCAELPADDVETCIRYVKTKAPELDPFNPLDREKIAHEISKFFADPGRKYKQELEQLEAEKADYEVRLSEAEARIQQQETLITEMNEAQRQRRLEEQERTTLRWMRAKILTIAVIWLISESVIGFLVLRYGDGDNAFQKIVSSLPLFIADFAVLPLGIKLILRDERWRKLGLHTRYLLGLEK